MSENRITQRITRLRPPEKKGGPHKIYRYVSIKDSNVPSFRYCVTDGSFFLMLWPALFRVGRITANIVRGYERNAKC